MDGKFQVKHKQLGHICDVYAITYSTTYVPTPFFLVYMDDKFQVRFADEFEPYERDLSEYYESMEYGDWC
jgi:hypothetical protein